MKKTNVHINRAEVVISVKDLYKSFGDNHVLQGICLDICQGENLVVLGRSGTGKSVLIKIMAGLLKPDKGLVQVLGQEVASLSVKALDALRLKMGFSFQHSALYDSMTVGENLAFPLQRNFRKLSSAEVKKEVFRVLEAVGLPQTLQQFPAELSGGQRKRIGIARTLIMRPAIMLYDEPTAGLDPITCVDINSLINEVQEKYHTTSVIITHDLTCAKVTGDRIAILLDGQFAQTGPFEEVVQNSTNEKVKSFYDYNFIE
jgi:phospholipid/cholesterol/gamma-HCH transport system ATP-binding protein